MPALTQLRKSAFLFFVFLYSLCAHAQSPEPAARIDQLRAEIKHHDELYYKKAAPEISDTAYDALKRELREFEATHPELASANSPTQRIDDDARDAFFRRHTHRMPMLSLDNTYDEPAVRAFDQRLRKQLAAIDADNTALRYTIEPKIDGAGISLIYENGKLTRVLTRGDGTAGDDIIANTRAIRELPQQLRDDGNGLPALVEIRGEIYMTFADFERINAQRAANGLPLFANPRNLAAGTMKIHNADEVASRALRIFVYGLGACEAGATMRTPITTQRDLLERLRSWGLPVIEKYWLAETPEKLSAAIKELGALRPKLAYPIDGAVVKVDSFALQQNLGTHATAPRWAIAYKYTPKSVDTRLLSITWQVGRTGVLTPVAELEPVMLAGSKITRASLHNPREIIRKGLRPGDVVVIEKAGDIIPEIVTVKTEARAANAAATAFVFPKNCPACDTPLTTTASATKSSETETDADDSERRCANDECPAQVKGRIAYFASKACVNISGLGDATVDKLVSRGLVKNVADLYDLTPQKITTLDGFAEKSATRLADAINASRRADLWRVIMGLGIPDIAGARAKTLAKHFSSLDALAIATTTDETALAAISGVGKKAAASTAAWFANPANREIVERLQKARAER